MLDLPRSQQPIWREAYPESASPRYPPLDTDIEVDTAVVGAGITGLTTAYLLKRAGQRVAVLDKDTVGGGTSGRTTGKVTSQHGLTYKHLAKRHGEANAKAYASANQTAIETISEIIQRERIDCDWQQNDNYVFTTRASKVRLLKEEAEAAKRLGLPASFESATPLPFEVKGAVKFSGQGKIHLQKYLLGLAANVHGDGSHVSEDSDVVIIRDGTPGYIRTQHSTVTARSIVIATNVPTFPLLARGTYCALEYPTVTYAVAGKLEDSLDGMYISPDEDHYSIQPISISETRYLLIVGAGGHLPGKPVNKNERFRLLADYAERYFTVRELTHKWSDRDYLAYDGIPLVGKLYPWSRQLYVGTAFKKWGITNGTAAGIILRDLILKKDNPWAATFNSMRTTPVTSIPKFFAKQLPIK